MKFYLLLTLSLLLGCGGDEDRQEVLSKLRGIGAIASPLISMPSADATAPNQVELTVYATLPIGQTATIEPYVDIPSAFAISLNADQIAIQSASVEYKPYPGFQILSFKASLNVPVAAMFARFGGAGQVRYGFILKANDEEEKIVGNFLVYPEGSAELSWTNPEISVVTPTASAVIGSKTEVPITATLTNKNSEDLKLGWFASGGEIKNRRAKSTTWKTPDPGEQTLIFTARGRKSRGFAIQIITVKAE